MTKTDGLRRSQSNSDCWCFYQFSVGTTEKSVSSYLCMIIVLAKLQKFLFLCFIKASVGVDRRSTNLNFNFTYIIVSKNVEKQLLSKCTRAQNRLAPANWTSIVRFGVLFVCGSEIIYRWKFV